MAFLTQIKGVQTCAPHRTCTNNKPRIIKFNFFAYKTSVFPVLLLLLRTHLSCPERRKHAAQPTASSVLNKPACPGGISFFQITLEQTDTWECFTTAAGCGDSEQLPASEHYSSGMSVNRQRVQINFEIVYSLSITNNKYRC